MADRFELPPDMKVFAEKSVEQAKQAFEGFISAANKAVSTFEGPDRDRSPERQGRH